MNRSPYHIEYGVAPTSLHYVPFGSAMWEYLPYDGRVKIREHKMKSVSRPVMMVGYAGQRGGDKGYRVYCFDTNKVYVRKHLKLWKPSTSAPRPMGDASFRRFVRERKFFPEIKVPEGVIGAPKLTPLEAAARMRMPPVGGAPRGALKLVQKTLNPVGASKTVRFDTSPPMIPVGAARNAGPAAATPILHRLEPIDPSSTHGVTVWKQFKHGVYRGAISDYSPMDRYPYTVDYADGTQGTYTHKEMKKIRHLMKKLPDPGVPMQVHCAMANLLAVPIECPLLEQNRNLMVPDIEYYFGKDFDELPDLDPMCLSISTKQGIVLAGLSDNDLKNTLARDFAVPVNMLEATQGNNKKHWLPVIRKELNQLVRTETFRIVKTAAVPRGRRVISGKMVLAVKRGQSGRITKLKARFVAHGFRQQFGKDYHATFAPTVHKSSLRLLLSLGVRNKWLLKQFDVKGAFLLSDLQYNIFLRPPKIVAKLLNMREDEVWELQKTLYGLKQSANRWHADFTKEMIRLGFKRCPEDHCLFRRSDRRGELIVGVHVDDSVCVASNERVFKEFMQEFKFPTSDVGNLTYCLGLKVDYDGHKLVLTQSADIEAMAARYGLLGSKNKKTPMEMNLKLDKEMGPHTEEEKALMAKHPYRNLLGALQYCAWNRPDIALAVGKCSQFAQNPGLPHWQALKRILVYLYHTRHLGMTFGNRKRSSPKHNLIKFWVDSDHAGDYDNARSRTGLIIKCDGDTVESVSSLQKACTNSTAWAETKAIAFMVRKLDFYRNVLGFLGFPQYGPVQGFTDSEAALKLQQRGFVKYNMTHLRCDFQFVNDAIKGDPVQGKKPQMVLSHIAGKINPADVLTKALPFKAFYEYTKFMLNLDNGDNNVVLRRPQVRIAANTKGLVDAFAGLKVKRHNPMRMPMIMMRPNARQWVQRTIMRPAIAA